MKGAKKNIMIITVLLLVCAAVYLNWSYNNKWGTADSQMAVAEDAAMTKADDEYFQALAAKETKVSDYFAKARLTRQTSRDQALELLKEAAASSTASDDTINGAMKSISAMATDTMKETQVENQLIAKGFTDCVAYISDDGVTVSVPSGDDGLNESEVAQITDIVTSETGMPASKLTVVPVK